MRRTMVVLLASVAILTPTLAMANEVAVDAKVLMNAKVERNGKHVGSVQRIMVNPTTGRIEHVDVLMTEGQQRLVAVPWSGVKVFQDNAGHMTFALTSRAAGEASPSASPATSGPTAMARDEIRRAQQRLNERGYDPGPLDGVIGTTTEAALRAYQRDHGLSVSGRLDSPTVASLMSDARPTPTAATVRTAQQELRERGYYSGPVDGVIGPATESALRAYQRDRRLSVTGRLDTPTLRSLTS